MVKDKITHRSKGVAFVLFLERESAYKCIRALNGTQVCKRIIRQMADEEYSCSNILIHERTFIQ